MEIKKSEIIRFNNKVRFQTEVLYEDSLDSDLIWFEFDEKYIPFLTSSANPWLVCFAPFAFVLGQPLIINEPVDKTLLNNVKKSLDVLKSWDPSKKNIPIEADTYKPGGNLKPDKVASFFTGGVDSFYTVLRNDTDSSGYSIDYLIFILGIDIPLKNSDLFPKIIKKLSHISKSLKKEFIIITTNIRDTRYRETGWMAHYSYGLASAALTLEKLYSKVLLAAADKIEYYSFNCSGDHPKIIPLLSSNKIKFILDGAIAGRIEKTDFLSKFGIVLNNLKVCTESRADFNCSNCEKCYRTMVTIDLLGKLKNCRVFKSKSYNISKISKIYFKKNDSKISHWNEILTYAKKNNRKDITNAIYRSFKISRIINLFLPLIKLIKNKVSFRIGFFLEIIISRNIINKKKLAG